MMIIAFMFILSLLLFSRFQHLFSFIYYYIEYIHFHLFSLIIVKLIYREENYRQKRYRYYLWRLSFLFDYYVSHYILYFLLPSRLLSFSLFIYSSYAFFPDMRERERDYFYILLLRVYFSFSLHMICWWWWSSEHILCLHYCRRRPSSLFAITSLCPLHAHFIIERWYHLHRGFTLFAFSLFICFSSMSDWAIMMRWCHYIIIYYDAARRHYATGFLFLHAMPLYTTFSHNTPFTCLTYYLSRHYIFFISFRFSFRLLPIFSLPPASESIHARSEKRRYTLPLIFASAIFRHFSIEYNTCFSSRTMLFLLSDITLRDSH